MTENPAWGIEIARIDADGTLAYVHMASNPFDAQRYPWNVRPPRMERFALRSHAGHLRWLCRSRRGVVGIELVGGKEIHDEALMQGDMRASIFALCVLGADMRFDDAA